MVRTQVNQAQEQAQEWWVCFTPGMAASGCSHEWEGHFEHGVEDGAWDAGAVTEEGQVGFEFGDQHMTDYPVRPGNSEMALMVNPELHNIVGALIGDHQKFTVWGDRKTPRVFSERRLMPDQFQRSIITN